jgi:multiple sugar transport system substrate-binding protein
MTHFRTQRQAVLLAVCVLVASCLWLVGIVGCDGEQAASSVPGDTPSSAAEPIRILWAEWPPADALQEFGNDYQKLSGVPVTVVKKSWAGDFQNTAFNEFRNRGTTYDIVVGDSQWLGLGVSGGHYLDLTDWAKANIQMDRIAPAAWKWYCEYPKGSSRYFAVPCEADVMAWFYRKDLFEDPAHKAAFRQYLQDLKVADAFDLAPPKTWEQLRLVAQYFKDKAGLIGVVMPTSRDYDMATMSFQQVMWGFGGDYGDFAKSTVAINSPQTVEALTFFTRLMDATSPGGKNMTFDEVVQSYISGQAVMGTNFMAFFPGIAASDYGDRTGYFNVPAGPVGRFASLGGQGMSINAHITPDRQQKAKDFIKWLSTPETQARWASHKGCFTSTTSVMTSDSFKLAAPYNPLFEEAFGLMRDFWSVPQYDQLLQVCQREFCAVWQDRADAEQAAKNVQREHEQILKSAP